MSYNFSIENENKRIKQKEHLEYIKPILEELLNGKQLGYRNIAKRLNEMNIKTVSGRAYNYQSVFNAVKALQL